ncbi:hypothetical protein FACS1894110_19280 [Spirochaetia bacterium]|nr:hypothetical protein FACS1894110_19280 [Spirochaetia bacterium]
MAAGKVWQDAPGFVYPQFDDYAHVNAALGINLRTVKNHLSRIYYKTGVASRADLWKM